MHLSELCLAPISEVAPLLEKRDVSPIELCDAMLERITELDGELGSYVYVAGDIARQQARTAETEILAGRYLGSLHGVPLGIKDIFFTTDMPTVCGSPQLFDWRPSHNAYVVDRLHDAGAVLLGKQATAEFAFMGYHPDHFKPPVNPWNADRWAGVSSGGSSVAVAAALCFGSFGTDTGGSIRAPSAVNGIVGLKPTFGRVSRRGVYPFAETLDHVGPLARSVRDAAILYQAVVGPDVEDTFSVRAQSANVLEGIDAGVAKVRVGFDLEYWEQFAVPEVVTATQRCLRNLEQAGAQIVAVDMKGIVEVCDHWLVVAGCEAMQHHGRVKFSENAAAYGPDVRRLLEGALRVTVDDLAKAASARRRVDSLLDGIFSSVDFLILPGMGLGSPTVRDLPAQLDIPPEAVASALAFTAPFNFSGHPTLSIPSALNSEGMPLGVQLVGRRLDERGLLRVGYTLEQSLESIGHPKSSKRQAA